MNYKVGFIIGLLVGYGIWNTFYGIEYLKPLYILSAIFYLIIGIIICKRDKDE